MSSSSNLHHRPDIDGLRAVAVLAVVAFHATKRISGGFVGVDVFFVISGFLITGIILSGLEGNSFNLSNFFLRRIRRIFPALLIVIASSWLLGWFILGPQGF
jgi:peptidoglycan/LPS O-acetylase OafA/YrhL